MRVEMECSCFKQQCYYLLLVYCTLAMTVGCVHGIDITKDQSDDVAYSTTDDKISPDGVRVHFTAKPPVYSLGKEGRTVWYSCHAEIVQNVTDNNQRANVSSADSSGNKDTADSSSPSITVTVEWVTPDNVPHYNSSGTEPQSDWSTLPGHGYFVAHDFNDSLVLVHPQTTDSGAYVCRAFVDGRPVAEVSMQLHIINPTWGSLVTRTLWGLLGASVVFAALAIGCLVNRFVIQPYTQRLKGKESSYKDHGSVIQDVDETRPSLQEVA